MGHIGCHQLSSVFKALKLGWPESVEASSTHYHQPTEVRNETAPKSSIVTFRFPAQGNQGEILLRWYDGGMMPVFPKEAEPGRKLFQNDGTMIVGDEGVLVNHRLLPEKRMQEFGKPKRVLARSPGHYKEWLQACKGGAPAGSDCSSAPCTRPCEPSSTNWA